MPPLGAKMPTNYKGTPIERFMKFVNKTEKCWLWTGARFRAYNGDYGAFSLAGRPQRAHRVAYLLFKGEIPKRLHVLHECDNPSCVNPKHLFLGTHQDNMTDCINKGRMPQVNRKRSCQP